MTTLQGAAQAQLRQFVEQLERLAEEKKAIAELDRTREQKNELEDRISTERAIHRQAIAKNETENS